MLLAFLGLMLASPFLVLGVSLFRAAILCYPAMLGLGALHSHIPAVPPLGWVATFWLVFVLGLLIPTSSTSSD